MCRNLAVLVDLLYAHDVVYLADAHLRVVQHLEPIMESMLGMRFPYTHATPSGESHTLFYPSLPMCVCSGVLHPPFPFPFLSV